MDELRALEFVPGALEQSESLPQTGAVTARAVGDRGRPCAVQDVGAHGIRKRRKQLALARIGRDAVRRQIAAVEITRGAFVEVEEVVVIDPLEVEQVQDRLAHANIGEDRTARIEHQALHALGQSVRKILLGHAAFAQRRKIVGGLPASRIGFHAQIVKPFLEGFEMRVAVAIIVVADGIEIPEAAIDRQIAAPIIRIAFEGDAFAGSTALTV